MLQRMMESAVGLDKFLEAEAKIPTARVWHDPDRRASHPNVLAAPPDVAVAGDCSVSRFAQEGDIAGSVTSNFARELNAARGKFFLRDINRGGSRSIDDRGEAEAKRKDGRVVLGLDLCPA
nr:hypothetical protein [Mesorhizobium sp. BR1-1-9]